MFGAGRARPGRAPTREGLNWSLIIGLRQVALTFPHHNFRTAGGFRNFRCPQLLFRYRIRTFALVAVVAAFRAFALFVARSFGRILRNLRSCRATFIFATHVTYPARQLSAGFPLRSPFPCTVHVPLLSVQIRLGPAPAPEAILPL